LDKKTSRLVIVSMAPGSLLENVGLVGRPEQVGGLRLDGEPVRLDLDGQLAAPQALGHEVVGQLESIL
jgi:hypothetical protein